jgi:hypothetical protein
VRANGNYRRNYVFENKEVLCVTVISFDTFKNLMRPMEMNCNETCSKIGTYAVLFVFRIYEVECFTLLFSSSSKYF